MKLIARPAYLEKLIGFKEKQLIKVITGIRRCGKSTLLEMYRQWLLEHGVGSDQIIAINFEDYDFYELRQAKLLHSYVKQRLRQGRTTYIFFDEVQHVENFAEVVDSLYIRAGVDLYITGSNAYMLSSQIATLLSGRYVEIPVLPLSFREYVDGRGAASNLAQKYSEYISWGSFPYVLDLEEWGQVSAYLSGIYDTVVVKDIVSRNKISDVLMLESVIRFLADNIGNALSMKKISDTMVTDGRKMDSKTVERYVAALCESFVLYRAMRYNIRGKQLLKTMEKYYLVDMGLRRVLLGSRSFDAGRILENVVYLELLRREPEVYVGKMDDLEVDFVVRNDQGLAYYQVAATVRSEDTLRRELASLQRIKDQYPKWILTLDEDPDADYDGIRRINALRWLLG